jgi:hypothetical protein
MEEVYLVRKDDELEHFESRRMSARPPPSSSSLSLQPSPVVRPRPSRRTLPLRWRLFRRSRSSRVENVAVELRESIEACDMAGEFVRDGRPRALDVGESRPSRTIKFLIRGDIRVKKEGEKRER